MKQLIYVYVYKCRSSSNFTKLIRVAAISILQINDGSPCFLCGVLGLLKVEERTKLTIWSEKILLVTPNLPAGSAYRRWRIIRLYLPPMWPIENGKQLLIWSCHTHFNRPFRNNLDHHFYTIFVPHPPYCVCVSEWVVCVTSTLDLSRVYFCLFSLCDPSACLPESRWLDSCRMMYNLLFFRLSHAAAWRKETGKPSKFNFPSQSNSVHGEEQQLTWAQHNKAAYGNSLCSKYYRSVSENGIKLDPNLCPSA